MPRKRTSIQPRVSSFALPHAVEFPAQPEALTTEKGTRNQIRADEETYIWGVDDAFPLRILKAIDESPTAMACLGMVESFVQGAGFEDEGLMTMSIDKYGTTLWELHCQLSTYLSQLDGFAVNFKIDPAGQITNTYQIPFETARMVAPPDKGTRVDAIKVNPYFGTGEYQNEFTTKYPVWDADKTKLGATIKQYGGEVKFPGMVYFFGIKRPLYKHYPVPKYWSAENAIYSDAKIMEFIKNTLQNGFFQSVNITMIGNPDADSTDPKHQETITGDDGGKRKKSTKTMAEAYDEYMSKVFSGSKKAGTAMVTWALTKDTAPIITAFPSNINFDLLSGTEVQNMRKITVATQVPAILVNLPEQSNPLGSGGNLMETSIELMQSRTAYKRSILEQFYNTVLLPNLQNKTAGTVKIKQYRPAPKMVDIPDKIWEAVPPESKVAFIKANYPEIPIIETPAPIPGTPDQPAQVDPNQEAVDSLFRSLPRSERAKLYAYANDYKNGRATLEQTIMFLKAYKLTDEQIKLFISEST